jgi:outer membrane protein TolC
MLGMEKSSLEEARAMAGAARSSYLPETMIKWRSQRVGPLPGSNDLMFEATLPLWFWARQNRSAEEADRQVASRQANLEVVKNTLRLELKEHLTLLGIFRKKILLYDKTLLPSARSMLQSSLTGYQAGQIDFLMLLDSIRSFRDISQSYFEALADYHIKLAELEEIVGQEIK